VDEKGECPLCNEKISDFIVHLRFSHEIDNSEKFFLEKDKLEIKKTKQLEFRKYIEELQLKKKNGQISDEEYRELITKWFNRDGI